MKTNSELCKAVQDEHNKYVAASKNKTKGLASPHSYKYVRLVSLLAKAEVGQLNKEKMTEEMTKLEAMTDFRHLELTVTSLWLETMHSEDTKRLSIGMKNHPARSAVIACLDQLNASGTHQLHHRDTWKTGWDRCYRPWR